MTDTPRIFLVSRHSGTVDWLHSQHLAVTAVLEHLDINEIQAGDTVVGTLPIQLAAAVCERNAFYHHLSLDVPQGWRGRDLSVSEVEQCNPRLEQFDIQRIGGAGG